MPQGLQIFNASGQIIFNTEDRLTRLLGFQIISGNGSIVVPALATGTPFFFVHLINGTGNPLTTYPRPSISGTTISWLTQSTPYTSAELYYGVY